MKLKEKIEMYYNVRIKGNEIILTLKETGEAKHFLLRDKDIYLGYGFIKGKLDEKERERFIKEGKIDKVSLKEIYRLFTGMSEELIEAMIMKCDVETLRYIKELEKDCDEETLETIEELKGLFKIMYGTDFVCKRCGDMAHFLNFKGDLKETYNKLKNQYCEYCLEEMKAMD